jgi:hypothetical protein
MTKETLTHIIEKYKEAEEQVCEIDDKYGIRIWNSARENFYNKYNYIIFKLFEELYGTNKTELLEEYIFEQISEMTFDELYDYLEN